MCGIVAYWARESTLSAKEYHVLLKGAEQRGQDGVGITISYLANPRATTEEKVVRIATKYPSSYSKNKKQVLAFIMENMRPGAVLIASCRATPETEPVTDSEMIQPIAYDNFVLSHNGGVTESIKKERMMDHYHYQTKIDSEMILAAYRIHGHNMKRAMEFLSGSFAFIMLDTNKSKLYAVNSFNPLAHMYVKGYGYFYHSDNDTLEKVLRLLGLPGKDGSNVWESWYHHYLKPYSIIETDLESGAQAHSTYNPRFLHPTWNSMRAKDMEKTYVVASGGIDSGLTAYLLKLVGRDVGMIHFHYGQKSEEAEAWAITKLSKHMGNVPYIFFDLDDLYRKLAPNSSMLLDHSSDVPIDSGGEYIKSTIAWVPGRNAIFAALAMAHAESAILKHNYVKVYIAAGWSQLSEETGGYPDNSFYFQAALNMLRKTGYITSSRIEFLPVLQRLTKTECWKLGGALGFPFEYTVSCDNPEMRERRKVPRYEVPHLCQECGSTKLSILAADRADVTDKRLFTTERKTLSDPSPCADLRDIISRLMLTQAEKEKLARLIKWDT